MFPEGVPPRCGPSAGHTHQTHLSCAKEDGRPCPVESQLPSVEAQGDHCLLREAPQLFPDDVGTIPETEATCQGINGEEARSLAPLWDDRVMAEVRLLCDLREVAWPFWVFLFLSYRVAVGIQVNTLAALRAVPATWDSKYLALSSSVL